MIRMGDSGITKVSQITPEARAVEGRRFMDWETEWIGIADKCIKENKYSITTVCLNYDPKPTFIPNETQWRNYIEETVIILLSRGLNKNNGRIDLINEPTKYCRTNDVPDVEVYLKLEHWAVDQVNGRLMVGSGCDELLYDSFQDNIARRGKAPVYVIHIQASCDTEDRTTMYVVRAKHRADIYGKILDCNEGNYKNVSTSSGYNLMKFQMLEAERNGCACYLNVFNGLVKSGYKGSTSQWDFLCFKIDGQFRSSAAQNNYNKWVGLMNSKAPIPNIVVEDDDMKLDKLYRTGSRGIGVKFIQMVVNIEMEIDPPLVEDGIWGAKTEDAVKAYQIERDLAVDGIVGSITMKSMISDYPEIWDEIEYEYAIGVR
jgi:peptidoglycan hydrolase-like protein with peptidoglycan-binding domain